ncbi:helix-turn-helix transcriptional regulator [Hydrotalea flava]|uniref:helix-turn-helix transcriptional regulator n=1 Tax=Hydrotalea flava TaxID=714549 RepID=UPI000834F88B|nr:helix-turn-helix transcriptional regulator [Hydrotalea flava]
MTLGEAVIAKHLGQDDLSAIRVAFNQYGFDIADKEEDKLVVKIHSHLCKYLNMAVTKERKQHPRLPAYLPELMHCNYNYLSKIFSDVTGVTIEKYYTRLKTEKAKELIVQRELCLADIALHLGYRSQQTFRTRFRKETGVSPDEYKLQPVSKKIQGKKLLRNILNKPDLITNKSEEALKPILIILL